MTPTYPQVKLAEQPAYVKTHSGRRIEVYRDEVKRNARSGWHTKSRAVMDGKAYPSLNHALAAIKDESSVFRSDAKLDTLLLRIKSGGSEYWVCGHLGPNGEAMICNAHGFDTQQDMHARMRSEGRPLKPQEQDKVIALLAKEIGPRD